MHVLQLGKNEKATYKLASDLIDQIHDLEDLRNRRVRDEMPELDSALSNLSGYVPLHRLKSRILTDACIHPGTSTRLSWVVGNLSNENHSGREFSAYSLPMMSRTGSRI